MKLLGASHLAVLFVCISGIAGVSFVSTRAQPAARRQVAVWLAVVLVVNKLVTFLRSWALGYLTPQNALPMHLCDWALFLVVIALLTGRRGPCELAYFWGLAGTFQAIVTPDLRFDFPAPEYFLFFISHIGIVLGAISAPLLHRLDLGWGSVMRAFLWLQFYAACAMAANHLVGSNYGYLAAKPRNPSVLDWFGQWPWYILAMELAGVILFSALLGFWRVFAPRRPVATSACGPQPTD